MRYLYAAIAAIVLLALWGRFGEGLGTAGNAVMLLALILAVWAIVRWQKR